MNMQSFDSIIVWAIIALGFATYYQLIFCIIRTKSGLNNDNNHAWQETLAIGIGALPLLGLLGTIMGLLDAFTAMSQGQGLNQTGVLTQGIASALWTTQLGLVIAVPGWLMLSYYKKLQAHEALQHAC